MTTTFTIAIPTHDRRETVVLATRSALRQTRPPLEVLVLCDGCTDGTEGALEELEDARIVPLVLPKLPGYAYGHRNVALEQARGTAILWLGDDDLLLPEHLERLGALWDTATLRPRHRPIRRRPPGRQARVVRRELGCRARPRRSRAQEQQRDGERQCQRRQRPGRRRLGDASLPRWGDWDLWKRVLAAGGRAGAIGDPTVLHFRATDRVQPWSDRVRQNTAWSERLDDAAELAGIRRALGALRDDRDTRILGLLADCERELAWIRATRWWRLRVWLARMRSRATQAES